MIGVFYGCTTRSDEKLKANLEKFFQKSGIEYVPMGTKLCCGATLLLAGYQDEFIEQAKKVKAEIDQVDTVVTSCAHCYTILSKEYEEFGIEVKPKILHITEYVKQLLDEGKIKLKKTIDRRLAYHDPCYIGRESKGIYEEPRAILDAVAEKRVDFELNRQYSTCCGGGGLVRAFLPKLSIEVAKEKIELQAKPLDVEVITSACPFCYQNLLEGAEGTGVEVFDFLEIVNQSME